jgi:hypothetical protein
MVASGPTAPVAEPAAAPINPYAGTQEREEVFEFSERPTVVAADMARFHSR